ncbi:hypothetical protein N9X87_00115 [bacterium]|nr:hypothetical protein [bacterium]
MTIEYVVPASIAMKKGARPGWERSVMGSPSELGGSGEPVTHESRNRVTYAFSPAMFDENSGKLEMWEALLHNIELGVKHFRVAEHRSRVHRKLLCGPPGDGVRTTFPISCISPTVLAVELGIAGADIWQDPSTFTIHSAGNLLSVDQFNAAGGISDSQAYGTCVITQEYGIALTGNTSFRVTPTGVQTNVGVEQTLAALQPVTAGRVYTGVSHCKGVGNFYTMISWYSAAKQHISNNTSAAPVTGDGTAVVVNTITATAPTSPPTAAAYARVIGFRTTSSDKVFFAGGLALNPGDWDRAIDPGSCYGLIEFDSAVASAVRPTCTAIGKRLSRCELVQKGKCSYRALHGGLSAVDKVQLSECAERHF